MKNTDKSSRQLKVEQLIKQSLAEIFIRGRRMHPLLIDSGITITSVEVSQDLKHANCYFLPFSAKANKKVSHQDLDQENEDEKKKDNASAILEAIESSKYAIRHQLTESINLKFSPELKFYYDKGLENAIEVEAILKKL